MHALPRADLEPAPHARVERRPEQPGGHAQGVGQRRFEPAHAGSLPGDQVLRRHRARCAGPAARVARAGRAAVLSHSRRRARERARARRRTGRAASARRRAYRRGADAQPELERGGGGQGRDGPLPRRRAGQRAAVRYRALAGGRHPRVRRLVVRERGVGRRPRAGERRQATVPLLRDPAARRRRRRHGRARAAHR